MKTLIWSAVFVMIALAVAVSPEASGGAIGLSDRDADRALVGGPVFANQMCGPATSACITPPANWNNCAAAGNLFSCITLSGCANCTTAATFTICGPPPVTYGGAPPNCEQFGAAGASPCGTQNQSLCSGTFIPPLAFTCVCPAGPFPATANPCGQTNCRTFF
jgi:hypothetical protein